MSFSCDKEVRCAAPGGERDGRGHRQTESKRPPSGQQIYSPGTVSAPPNPHRRRATATPSRNATKSEPRGASRAILLKMLSVGAPIDCDQAFRLIATRRSD